VPGRGAAKDKLGGDSAARLGVDARVDDALDLRAFGRVGDRCATFDWGDGGVIRVRAAFWIVGAPRVDKVAAPRIGDYSAVVDVDAAPPGAEVFGGAEAADRLATFWGRACAEFNVAKAVADPSCAQPGAASRDAGARQCLGLAEGGKVRPPEGLSCEARARCLLRGLELPAEAPGRCWGELAEILAKRAGARLAFVAALAKWANVRDMHKPRATGSPGKAQRGARVDDEHPANERASCKVLFPQKLVRPGDEGALIKMMEHIFALCIEKSRGKKGGTGSAVLRWFSMQAISEVKSQLERVHLILGAPRFICSREFDAYALRLKAETRQARTKEKLLAEGSASAKIVEKSQAEQCATRREREVPSDAALMERRALSGQPPRQFVVRRVGAPASDSDEFFDVRSL
ncbi:unnamed protein product, partial [Prorocentrum cordatum]